ncbi:MAG TPA: hypothetical protein PLV68_19080, partial [Ilumatobacteraceae bacterium]|nr:hypothetical protein [Ilumatobacteraceae bacterium]
SIGPSRTDQDQLRTLRQAITAAEANVLAAQQTLDEAKRGPSGAELLQLQQSLSVATDQVPIAQGRADRNNRAAVAQVQSAIANRDSAIRQRDAAKAAADAAKVPGAIDPNTGEAYTAQAIAALDNAVADA